MPSDAEGRWMATTTDLPSLVDQFSKLGDLSFDEKAGRIAEVINSVDSTTLVDLLTSAGAIPEAYDHDSSEEKLYAKAMDILVGDSFRRAGYSTIVNQERSGAADVTAVWTGESSSAHSLVIDAKAFRLSRTALNPKDYKIEALSTWRRDADYALLVGPVAGFPEGTSRLYAEALRYKVALLSYSHLAFMTEHAVHGSFDPRPIWESSEAITRDHGKSPTAGEYWAAFDVIFQEALGVEPAHWHSTRQRYLMNLLKVAHSQVSYFEEVKNQIRNQSPDELVALAIDALKIDNKIEAILRRSGHAQALLDEIAEVEE
ncbi:MAG: HindIII family type II restriction endonuclease [Streptosporangiaceae bacterium]